MQILDDDGIVLMLKEQRKFLNARCKDLLEITEVPEAESTPLFLKYKVDFLHRTVRDFLTTSEIYDSLKKKAASCFSARKALCRAHLAQIKACYTYFFTVAREPDLEVLLREAIFDAYDIEAYHGLSEIAHLEELDRFVSVALSDAPSEVLRYGPLSRKFDLKDHPNISFPTVVTSRRVGIRTTIRSRAVVLMPTRLDVMRAGKEISENICWADDHKAASNLLLIAVEARLYRYVAYKLKEDPTIILEDQPYNLLNSSLNQTRKTSWAREWFPASALYLDVNMIRLLLDHGANPNATSNENGSFTPWQHFLFRCSDDELQDTSRKDTIHEYRQQLFIIAAMMVEHGADVDLGDMTKDQSSAAVLKQALQPQDWARLIELIKKRKIGIELMHQERIASIGTKGRWSRWLSSKIA